MASRRKPVNQPQTTAAIPAEAAEMVKAVRHLVGLEADPEPLLEQWLEQAGRHAHFDFGGPSFRPVEPHEADALDEQLRKYGSK